MNVSKYSPKNMIIAVLAGLCIAVYVCAGIFALVKITGIQNERHETIRAEWDDIESLASAAGALGFMDEPFILAIEDAIVSSRSIEAVIISGPDGEYAFERRKGTSINWVNGSPRFRSGFGLQAASSRPLRIDGQRNVNIQTLSAAIDYDALLRVLKQTLIIVLSALAFSFFVLLLETLVVKKEPVRNQSDDEHESGDDDDDIDFAKIENSIQAGQDKDDDDSIDLPDPDAVVSVENSIDSAAEAFHAAAAAVQDDEPESEAEAETETESANVPAENGPEETGFPEEAFVPEEDESVPYDTVKATLWEMHKPENEEAETEEAELASASAEQASASVEASPHRAEGLYSPRGGIGWEEYTQDRLSAELHRCASFEQDLSLIMMEFKKSPMTISIDNEFYKKFTAEAVEFFAERDLIFENGEGGITVIYPNMDLDQAFSKSEEFHNRILARYPEVFKSKSDLCVGISSRAGRLIDGGRLLFETREALQRAVADPVAHIVAFKSDPEKYRQYLRGKTTERAAS